MKIFSYFTHLDLYLFTLLYLILLFFKVPIIIALTTIIFFMLLFLFASEYLKIRKYFHNIFLVIFSFFITIIFIEVYLHLAEPKFLNFNNIIYGEFSDYTRRGYLDESVFKKKENTYRMLGLGDSFAVNMRMQNKNYHNLLQAMFKAKGQNQVEVVNAGMEFIGPGYYYHILEKYGELLKPDLVLVGFFMGNDLNEWDFDRFHINGFWESRVTTTRLLGYLQFDNLWLFKLFYTNKALSNELKRKNEELRNWVVKKEATLSKGAFISIERKRMWIVDKNMKPYLTKLVRYKSKAILNIKEWCSKRNVKLLIALFPDNFQVDDSLRQELIDRYKLSIESIDIFLPNNLLSNFLRKNNIKYIDLLDDFRKVGKTNNLYLLRNTHWNEEGNKLTAEIIFNYLQKNGLVPFK